MAVDRDFIRNLAEANGLHIPEQRLDAVLRQYQSFLRSIERVDTVPLPRETEPALDYSLESIRPPSGNAASGGRR
ncbi:MAG TPA: AtzG-like protein [Terriglobia bacterium]|nr:AtzG-like protein [Terriglobia bacterium]